MLPTVQNDRRNYTWGQSKEERAGAVRAVHVGSRVGLANLSNSVGSRVQWLLLGTWHLTMGGEGPRRVALECESSVGKVVGVWTYSTSPKGHECLASVQPQPEDGVHFKQKLYLHGEDLGNDKLPCCCNEALTQLWGDCSLLSARFHLRGGWLLAFLVGVEFDTLQPHT